MQFKLWIGQRRWIRTKELQLFKRLAIQLTRNCTLHQGNQKSVLGARPHLCRTPGCKTKTHFGNNYLKRKQMHSVPLLHNGCLRRCSSQFRNANTCPLQPQSRRARIQLNQQNLLSSSMYFYFYMHAQYSITRS